MKTRENTIRKYIEKKHYSKKEGGGSFYRWFDINFTRNKIEVYQLHSMEDGKKLPKEGSGSAFSLTIQEAKILSSILNKVLNNSTPCPQ